MLRGQRSIRLSRIPAERIKRCWLGPFPTNQSGCTAMHDNSTDGDDGPPADSLEPGAEGAAREEGFSAVDYLRLAEECLSLASLTKEPEKAAQLLKPRTIICTAPLSSSPIRLGTTKFRAANPCRRSVRCPTGARGARLRWRLLPDDGAPPRAGSFRRGDTIGMAGYAIPIGTQRTLCRLLLPRPRAGLFLKCSLGRRRHRH